MYESDEVIKCSQLFREMAHAVIGDRCSQKEEAYNIGVAPQTINNWLVNYRHDMPAFALAEMSCGNIILERLLAMWKSKFSDRGESNQMSEIQMLIIEHIGVINSIIKKDMQLGDKNEVIERIQKLKEAVGEMEVILYKIMEGK